MTFISILAALIAERFLLSLERHRQLGWYASYVSWMDGVLSPFRITDGPLGVVLVLGPLLLLLGLVQNALDNLLFGIPGFILGTLVLLFCLGPKDLKTQVEEFMDASYDNDWLGARETAAQLIDEGLPQEPTELTRRFSETVLSQANNSVFAVLFWFVVLGPVGAALYRLSSRLRQHAIIDESSSSFANSARRLMQVLDWAPIQLTAGGYALCGSLDGALNGWKRYYEHWDHKLSDADPAILVYTGNGALLHHEHNATAEDPYYPQDADPEWARSAMNLVGRTLVLWVSLLALVTVSMWLA